MEKRNHHPETVCIQGGWNPGNGEPRVLPIYQSTTFKYSSSEQMGRLFDLEEDGYFIRDWPIPPTTQWRKRSVSWREGRQPC